MSIYQDHIRDHYHNPRFKGIIESPDVVGHIKNPSCGDIVIFTLKMSENRVVQVGFDGAGCVISQATASMLAQALLTKSIDEITQLSESFMQELLGAQLGPVRMRCALLPLQAVQKGIQAYAQKSP